MGKWEDKKQKQQLNYAHFQNFRVKEKNFQETFLKILFKNGLRMRQRKVKRTDYSAGKISNGACF